MTPRDQARDHVPIEERPTWFAMKEEHWACVCRPFIDVVHPEAVYL